MVSSRLILAAAVLTLAIFAGIIHAQEKWVGNIYNIIWVSQIHDQVICICSKGLIVKAIPFL